MKAYLLIFIIIVISCKQNTNHNLPHPSKSNLDTQLTHIVLFKLKDKKDKTLFKSELQSLKQIKNIKTLSIGERSDQNDERAYSNYDIALSLVFSDSSGLLAYKNHPAHLSLKNLTLKMLESPPTTIDFIAQHYEN